MSIANIHPEEFEEVDELPVDLESSRDIVLDNIMDIITEVHSTQLNGFIGFNDFLSIVIDDLMEARKGLNDVN